MLLIAFLIMMPDMGLAEEGNPSPANIQQDAAQGDTSGVKRRDGVKGMPEPTFWDLSKIIAFAALGVASLSLYLSWDYRRKSFRPIVTTRVKTHWADDNRTYFNLEIRNSGSLPAKNIHLIPDKDDLKKALGDEATPEKRKIWLSCFEAENAVSILEEKQEESCSFGYTKEDGKGFWQYKAIIPITIEYDGWFGEKYTEKQEIRILDSASFTGSMWAKPQWKPPKEYPNIIE